VGPSLRIDNLPDHYPLKKKVIKHENQFWKKKRLHKKPVKFYKVHIDTTFAMYRGDHVKKNDATMGARLCPPFTALHLDWYLDPDNLTEDQVYYLNAKDGLTHYGGKALKRAMGYEVSSDGESDFGKRL